MNKLKELREKRKISLRDLSEAIAIDHTALSRIENGKRGLSGDDIIKLCSFFNVSADYFLGLSDDLSSAKFSFFGEEANELTQDQIEDVKRYIEFIRTKTHD